MPTLERNAEKLYQAIAALGVGWHGRPEIADYLGKARLTGQDAAALDLLIMQGRIIAERHELPPPTGGVERRWEYKSAEQEAGQNSQKHQQESAIKP